METSTDRSRESVVPQSLLSVVSHEIRGAIGVARGYLRMLCQDPALPEKSIRAARGAADAVDRVVGLLDELSEYARIARGDAKLERAPHAMGDLLDEAVSRVALPDSPRVAWRQPPEGSIDVVSVDRPAFVRALTPLVDALARAQTEDAELTAAARGEPGGEPAVEIVVEISDRASSREPDLVRGGLGLSLVVADALIRAHGATLVERWIGERWVGYRIAGLRAGPPREPRIL